MVEAPQYMEQGQKVLSIPIKKAEKPPLMYLPLDSIKGLLEQPDLMENVMLCCLHCFMIPGHEFRNWSTSRLGM